MDPRQRKLRLALWILGLGTLLALVWHGYQGWGLGRGYPYNSYLYLRPSAFTDWTGVVQLSALPTPYAHEFAVYFPATYVLFRPLVWMDTAVAKEVWPDSSPSLIIYLAVILLATVLLHRQVLKDLVLHPAGRTLTAIGLTLGSYPLVFCFDRGNVELGMVLLVGGALLYCRRTRFGPAVLLLAVPILLKLYPILLLALFLRRHHWRYLALTAGNCFILSALAMLTFPRSIPECLTLWRNNLAQYNLLYILGDRGFAGSASPWNALKAGILTADHFKFIDLHLGALSESNHGAAFLVALSRAYNAAFLGLVVGVVLFATLIEREFFRRAILLLLLIAICGQAGADYKLLWVHLALLALILLPTARRFDLAAVTLMALVLVPKKEFYLTWLGPSDTTYNDISFGVVADPVLILAALALILVGSWRARIPGWSEQRLRGLAHEALRLIPRSAGPPI